MAEKTTRLNKFIADSGYCSRRKADALIAEGQVTVNGTVQTAMGTQIDPQQDVVTVEGQEIGAIEKLYLILHKPLGYITTRSDERNRKTIYDLIPEAYDSVDPAGRLDRNSSGLLLLSNDGDFLNRVTHPKFHLEKIYEVVLERPLTEHAVQKLKKGVMLEPEHKLARMSRIEPVLASGPSKITTVTYRVTLITGYNRQIRRALELSSYQVKSLKRIAFGPVQLGTLKPGAIRALTFKEKAALTRPE